MVSTGGRNITSRIGFLQKTKCRELKGFKNISLFALNLVPQGFFQGKEGPAGCIYMYVLRLQKCKSRGGGGGGGEGIGGG